MKEDIVYIPLEISSGELPNDDRQYLFYGDEIPPIHAGVIWNGEHPSLLVYESSGETEYEDINNYTAWLKPVPLSSLIDERVKGLVSALEDIVKPMKEDIVYIPIDVEKELPTDRQRVIWQMNGGGQYEGYWDESEGKNWVYLIDDKEEVEAFAFSDFSTWLKPVPLSSLMDERVKGLIECLRELVYLKSIKDVPEYKEDYERRKPLAWAAAKRVIGKENQIKKPK